jgi:hypothetical protein
LNRATFSKHLSAIFICRSRGAFILRFQQGDKKGREYSMFGRDEKCTQNCSWDILKGRYLGVSGWKDNTEAYLKKKKDMRM